MMDPMIQKQLGRTGFHFPGQTPITPFRPVNATTAAADVLEIPVTHGSVAKTTGADHEACTLADGSPGQQLIIRLAVAGGGVATITPSRCTGFTSVVLYNAGDYVVLEYIDDSIGWMKIAEFAGSDVIHRADKIIATGGVLALNATPIAVIPAGGSGVYHEFLGGVVFLDYAGTAYAADAGEDLCLRYTDGSGDIVSNDIDGEEFEATADAVYILSPVPTNPNVAQHLANTAIFAHIKSGEWATGTSPLKIRAFYRKHNKTALEAIA